MQTTILSKSGKCWARLRDTPDGVIVALWQPADSGNGVHQMVNIIDMPFHVVADHTYDLLSEH